MIRRNLPPSRRRAVTLLEVSLAMGLLVLLSSITYWFYSSALQTREQGTESARKLRLARVILNRITDEIRQVTPKALGGGVGLRGEPEAIEFWTTRLPAREIAVGGPLLVGYDGGECDRVRVEYHIARHPDVQHEDGYPRSLGLARSERTVPQPAATPHGLGALGSLAGQGGRQGQGNGEGVNGDQLPPGGDSGDGQQIPGNGTENPQNVGELPDDDPIGEEADEEQLAEGEPDLGPDINWQGLFAPEIHYIRFCYFDGNQWWSNWDVQGENPLPQLIHLTIGFDEHPPFGEQLGTHDDEFFCECMNRDPIDCDPQGPDQYSTVIRVSQADPFFRSRIGREVQALTAQLAGQGGGEENPQEQEGGGR